MISKPLPRNILSHLLLTVFIAASFFIISCSDDDDGAGPVVNSLAGTYVFESATFVEEVTITIQGNETTFPPGSSASGFVESALLNNAPCGDPDDTQLELREDGTSFFTCAGDPDNSLQQGTWTSNDSNTELTLVITLTSPPTSVTIQDITMDGNTLSGRVRNFPLPRNADEPLGFNNIQLVPVDIVLEKQ